MNDDKPKSVAEFIQRGRDAGQDALGIVNDPEAEITLLRLRAERLDAELEHQRNISQLRLEEINRQNRIISELEAELNNCECECDHLRDQLGWQQR